MRGPRPHPTHPAGVAGRALLRGIGPTPPPPVRACVSQSIHLDSLRRYLRLAAACPDAFAVSGLVVRREEAGAELEAAWGVPSFRTVAELVAALPAERLLFIVIAVPQPANAEVLAEVVATGVPALGQTPAGWTLPELRQLHEDITLQGKRVQIAEQYLFQPAHMARLALIGSGRIGTSISQAMVSAATGYHGTSLLRHYLGVGAEECTVRATTFESPLMDGIGRYGSESGAQTVDARQGGLRNAVHGPKDGSKVVVSEEAVATSSSTLAWLEFKDAGKIGVCDWSGDQYFSSIRSSRILARGERGEINNLTVRYLQDVDAPAVEYDLRRVDVGPTEQWANSLVGCAQEGRLAPVLALVRAATAQRQRS